MQWELIEHTEYCYALFILLYSHSNRYTLLHHAAQVLKAEVSLTSDSKIRPGLKGFQLTVMGIGSEVQA